MEDDARGHLKNLKDLAPKFHAATDVEGVQVVLSRLSPWYVSIITDRVPLETCKDPTKWGQDIGEHLSRFEVADQLDEDDKFLASFDLELWDLDVSQSVRSDEAIDRKIKRLLQVKTGKQLFPGMRKTANLEIKLVNPPIETSLEVGMISNSKSEIIRNSAPADPDKQAIKECRFTPQDDGAEEAPSDIRGAASVSPNLSEKEHVARATIEEFTNPMQMTPAKLLRFSALCDDLRQQLGYPKEGLAAAL